VARCLPCQVWGAFGAFVREDLQTSGELSEGGEVSKKEGYMSEILTKNLSWSVERIKLLKKKNVSRKKKKPSEEGKNSKSPDDACLTTGRKGPTLLGNRQITQRKFKLC